MRTKNLQNRVIKTKPCIKYLPFFKCEGFDDKEKRIPLEVNVKSKNYNIQSPSTIVPLNSPVIEEYSFSKIATRIDICLGTNTTYAEGLRPPVDRSMTKIKGRWGLLWLLS